MKLRESCQVCDEKLNRNQHVLMLICLCKVFDAFKDLTSLGNCSNMIFFCRSVNLKDFVRN